MSDSSDLLCENRGPDGLRCTLPFNHGGDTHSYEIELPPNVAVMVAGYLDHLEQSQTQMSRSLRQLKYARWLLYAGAAFNIGIALWSLTRLLSV